MVDETNEVSFDRRENSTGLPWATYEEILCIFDGVRFTDTAHRWIQLAKRFATNPHWRFHASSGYCWWTKLERHVGEDLDPLEHSVYPAPKGGFMVECLSPLAGHNDPCAGSAFSIDHALVMIASCPHRLHP